MSRRQTPTRLPAPFLRSIRLREKLPEEREYPLNLPWLVDDFLLEFTTPVTILVGENGTGKSTLVEAIAALSGYDEAGGGKGYRPVDHSGAVDRSGAHLGSAIIGLWLPKVTRGWFFRAESFFSVARYLDAAAREAGVAGPDFLSWSHGEGFVRVFEERMSAQGIYFMDEPESALSPNRQRELLRILDRVQRSASSQIIMATHSPILMAVPGARLLEIDRHGFHERALHETRHFKLYAEFVADPEAFVADALRQDDTA
jgi:predicted ATPase